MDRQQTDFCPGAERSGQMEKSCGAVVFTRESGEIRYVPVSYTHLRAHET